MKNSSVEKLILSKVNWLNDDILNENIVLSSRIRLLRNISGIKFNINSDDSDKRQVVESFIKALDKVDEIKSYEKIYLPDLEKIDKNFLLERKYIDSKMSSSEYPYSYLVIDTDDLYYFIINEDDHIKIQSLRQGFSLKDAWKDVSRVDSEIERLIPFSFDNSLGFLTASPANLGTGLKASVMLNLPGLVISNQIQMVIRGVHKLGLNISGLYDSNTSYIGNLYQISNLSTLGETEEEIIDRVENIVNQVVINEKNARLSLLETKKDFLFNYIGRAYGIMRYSYLISEKEALDYLSILRMGVDFKMFKDLTYENLNDLIISVQNSNIQKLVGKEMSLSEIDSTRADIIRNKLQNFF